MTRRCCGRRSRKVTEQDIKAAYRRYRAAGGLLSYRRWLTTPCCTCLPRHGGPEMIRPPGENTRQKCIDWLAEQHARTREVGR